MRLTDIIAVIIGVLLVGIPIALAYERSRR